MECLICHKECQHLGSHIAKAHKITAREYKQEFGLDYNFPLISPATKLKKQIAFEEHREKYLKNLQQGTKYRFKKGEVHRKYFSKQSIEKLNRYQKELANKPAEFCPICKVKYKRLASHLYNKHKLIKIKI